MVLVNSGWVRYLGKRYEDASKMDLKALELDPNYWPALRDLGLVYEKMGRFPEAIAALQKARQLDTNPSILEFLAGAYVASATMVWLEKGLRERADCMPWAYSDSKLDMLRNDPQFIDLMRRMGLSPG